MPTDISLSFEACMKHSRVCQWYGSQDSGSMQWWQLKMWAAGVGLGFSYYSETLWRAEGKFDHSVGMNRTSQCWVSAWVYSYTISGTPSRFGLWKGPIHQLDPETNIQSSDVHAGPNRCWRKHGRGSRSRLSVLYPSKLSRGSTLDRH